MPYPVTSEAVALVQCLSQIQVTAMTLLKELWVLREQTTEGFTIQTEYTWLKNEKLTLV